MEVNFSRMLSDVSSISMNNICHRKTQYMIRESACKTRDLGVPMTIFTPVIAFAKHSDRHSVNIAGRKPQIKLKYNSHATTLLVLSDTD